MTPGEAVRIAERFLQRQDSQGWEWRLQLAEKRGPPSHEWNILFEAYKDDVRYDHGPVLVVVDERRAQARFFVTL